MGSPSRNVQYHPPRLSEDRLNLPQPHSPSLPTHCSGKSGMRPAYLEQFPNGVFRALVEARLVALRGSAGSPSAAGGDGRPRARTPYQLSTTIHRAPRDCGDTYSGRDRLYTFVRVIDPELERRIAAVERRTEQLLGSISMTHAGWDLDRLSRRELRSSVEPLSEAERRSLARLREAERAHERDPFARLREAERAFEQGRGPPPGAGFLGFAYEEELKELEVRVPLSAAESAMLRQGQELVDTWNRLKGERRSQTNPRWVRLFFVEEFLPYSWAFLPADASLQCSFRGDSNQASAYPRLSGGQPSLETVPNTVGLSPSGALPSGHSRGVLVRCRGCAFR